MWWQVALWAVSLVVSILTRPKPKVPPPPTFEDLKIPNSEEGHEIPVIFGSPIVKAAFIANYGGHRTRSIRTRQRKK